MPDYHLTDAAVRPDPSAWHQAPRRLLLLATGGTIASQSSANGLVPTVNIDALLKYCRSALQHYDVTARSILQLDSSNIQPEEWRLIAGAIVREADQYDGIVITHGTDTMAYTASALSFMLPGITIPVVLTGAQLPISHPLSDATENLATALAMAARGPAGVFIAFDRQVILGTRAVKVRTTDFHAFESINYPLVGYVNGDGLQTDPALAPHSSAPFRLMDQLDPAVFLLKLTPGLNPDFFVLLQHLQYRALVIEAFGIGGIHYLHRDLLEGISQIIAQGIVVVVTSQCLYERSDFSRYETGQRVLDSGAIPAFDMTSEACVTKLIWILGQTRDPWQVGRWFRQNLAGELAGPLTDPAHWGQAD
ncbi:asparaginase [Oscillospiraceae bacterium HV4-5-C5C]|nr:asparaginase [Oscillospiraceae bacterium HV4-5-C5C]